jgi:hypothetical protein
MQDASARTVSNLENPRMDVRALHRMLCGTRSHARTKMPITGAHRV